MIVAWRAHGRVQGVGYRYFVREEGQALGLGGWVRNEPDGTVSGEAEGSLSQLEAFRERLQAGTSYTRVSRLDWMPLDGAPLLPLPFEVRR